MTQSADRDGRQRRFGVYSQPLIVPPLRLPHTQTFILLHGRGSDAGKFGPPLLSTIVGPDAGTFQDSFPHARFVFPIAARSRATVYRRSIIRQWYDGSGDWEACAPSGIRETVRRIQDIVREEIGIVGGVDKVVLGGLSQGCAMGLLSMLTFADAPLAAVVGMCGFVPFARELRGILEDRAEAGDELDGVVVFEDDDAPGRASGGDVLDISPAHRALRYLRDAMGMETELADGTMPFQATPVFLGHGAEDDKVRIEFGRATANLLQGLGIDVQFRCYDGLGHWFSEAMVRDMAVFLKAKLREP